MNFVKRNAPVIIIGLVTVLVFVGIIVAGQKNPPLGPKLKEVSEEQLVSPHAYTMGNPNATVTLTEFSDFGCPACAAFQPVVKEMVAKYPTKLKAVFRHFPLPQHVDSEQASVAAQIAGEQGKFWEYGDILFNNQQSFKREDLIKYAEQLKLDMDTFTQALDSGKYETIVKEDVAEGIKLGINSTPTFYLNGSAMIFKTFEDFKKQIDTMVANAPEPTDATQIIPVVTPIALQNTATATPTVAPLSQEELDKKYGILKIEFTDKGFSPSLAQATEGQLVRWENKTASDVVLEQTMKRFKELTKPVVIKPNESYELRVYGYGYWTYRDSSTQKGGALTISSANKPDPSNPDPALLDR